VSGSAITLYPTPSTSTTPSIIQNPLATLANLLVHGIGCQIELTWPGYSSVNYRNSTKLIRINKMRKNPSEKTRFKTNNPLKSIEETDADRIFFNHPNIADSPRGRHNLLQWGNRFWLLFCLTKIPIHKQLSLMQFSPVQNKVKRATWHFTFYHCKCPYINKGFMLAVCAVKMRRPVLIPVHLDNNSKENADSGHCAPPFFSILTA